nr:MAG TPA_asm: hypothetical protein [Caudoviricetes sp.]
MLPKLYHFNIYIPTTNIINIFSYILSFYTSALYIFIFMII